MPALRKYPDELRERAVREARSSGRPVAHVARDLGIRKEAPTGLGPSGRGRRRRA
ncbi:transposase [Streptomyces flaveolus]